MRLAWLLALLAVGCQVMPDAESCRRHAEERRLHAGLDSTQVLRALGPGGISWSEQGYSLDYDCGDIFVGFEFDRAGACVATQTGPSLHTVIGVRPWLFTVRSKTPAFDSPAGARAARISIWRAESIEAERHAAGNWHVSQGLRWLGDAARIEWRDDGLLLIAGCEDGSVVRLTFGSDGMMTGMSRGLPYVLYQ